MRCSTSADADDTSQGNPSRQDVGRDFHADRPNRLWLTDITEFSLPFGKAHLLPILDCFGGKIVA